MAFINWFGPDANRRNNAANCRRRPRRRANRIRPVPEVLEDRLAPAVALTYGGHGTELRLTDTTGSPSTVSLSQAVVNNVAVIKIDLGGRTFDASSTPAQTGLTYASAGSPGASSFAYVAISQPNYVTRLTANLELAGDTLNVGTLANAAGGLGGLDCSATTINGTGTGGNGTSGSNIGVVVEGAQVTSTGTGTHAADIRITGTGGAGTDNNHGVFLSSADTLVTSVDGAITVTGTGGNGTSDSNMGVRVLSAQVASTSTGSIDLRATGGRGTGNDPAVHRCRPGDRAVPCLAPA
jgi:hypothetical protein